MVVYKSQMVQRPLNYAVTDETDSILIDEARTHWSFQDKLKINSVKGQRRYVCERIKRGRQTLITINLKQSH